MEMGALISTKWLEPDGIDTHRLTPVALGGKARP